MRFTPATLLLAGCLSNPTVDVDVDQVAVARGTSQDVTVLLDGQPLTHLDELITWIDNPDVASIVPAADGVHLRIGGNLEGDTVVHLNTRGETIDVPTHVMPPAVVLFWTEPARIDGTVGEAFHIRAAMVDSTFTVHEVTKDTNWAIRDPTMANVAGAMVYAMQDGETSLHANYAAQAAYVPVTIKK